MDKAEDFLHSLGIKDFDELNAVEREEYTKILEVVQTSQVTLEDYQKHVRLMRQSLEMSIVDEPEYIHSALLPFLKRTNPKLLQLKARLKNYLLLEAFFDRPERAKDMLDMYKKRASAK